MDSKEKLDNPENMYEIKYNSNSHEGSYELDTGFINLLKLNYNIAFAINDYSGCEKAKSAIDKLIDEYSKVQSIDSNVIELLINAADETFSLLKPNCKISINPENLNSNENCDKKSKDIFGEMHIKVQDNNGIELFKFDISQNVGHAYATHNTDTEINIDETQKSSYLHNKEAILLYNKSNHLSIDGKDVGLFNKTFLYKDFIENESDEFFTSSNTIKLYEDIHRLDPNYNADHILSRVQASNANWESSIMIGDKNISSIILEKFNNKKFMMKYLSQTDYKNEYIENNVDKEIKQTCLNTIRIKNEINNGTISAESLENMPPKILEEKIDYKPLIAIAIEKLNIDDFKSLLDRVTNINLSSYDISIDGKQLSINSLEHAALNNMWEKFDVLFNKLDGTIYCHTIDGDPHFLINSLLQNGKLQLIIDNASKFYFKDLFGLDDDTFALALDKLDQNKLNDSFYAINNIHLTPLEYAAKNNAWGKFDALLNKIDWTTCHTIDGDPHFLINSLLQNGKQQLIIDNASKFYFEDLFALDDDTFALALDKLDQNTLNSSFWSTDYSADLTPLEYAAKNNAWGKFDALLNKIDSTTYCHTIDGDPHFLINSLLQNGKLQLIIDNASKFSIKDLFGLDDDTFALATDKLNKNELTMPFSVDNNIYLTPLNYAAKNNAWGKLDTLLSKIDGTIHHCTVDGDPYFLINSLLQNGKLQLIIDNASKFYFEDLFVLDDGTFALALDKLDKNTLNISFWSPDYNADLTPLEYAAKNDYWNKLEIIANALETPIINRSLTVDGKETSLFEMIDKNCPQNIKDKIQDKIST